MELLAQAAVGGEANTAEVILFVVFGALALGAAVAMITMRNVVHAALMLVVNLLSIAALFLGLQSSFLSIIQVIVYAGAIVVLFLFVIMLLGVHRDDLLFDVQRRHRVAAVLGAAGLAAVLLFGIVGVYTTSTSRCGDQAPDPEAVRTATTQPCVGMDEALASSETGTVGIVADRMFGRYTFPFEVAAVLLTVATIGAMLLGRRRDVGIEEDPAYVPSADLPDADDLELALVGADEVSLAATEDDGPSRLVEDDPEVTAAEDVRREPDDGEDD